MGLTRITQYIHRPNATEIGLGNTHECYMLVGTDVDMSDIFPLGIDVLYMMLTLLKNILLNLQMSESLELTRWVIFIETIMLLLVTRF